MELHLTTRYYKHSKVGREPIRFHVRQPKGIGTDVHGAIWLDPILKEPQNADLREALIKHELNEIKVWGQGNKASHTEAKGREPTLTKNIGGVSGFWHEIKRRQSQSASRRIFPTWKAAHEFAKQKRAEGYDVEGCGGESTTKSQHYEVIYKKNGNHKQSQPLRLHAYVSETPDHIVSRMHKEHRKPLRSVKMIDDLAESALRQAGITGVTVLVKKLPVGGPHMDAAVRYTKVAGVNKPDQLIIHPMHQYTDDNILNRKIGHEINHLVELNRPHKGVKGHGYIDRNKTRLSRNHRKGFRQVRFT